MAARAVPFGGQLVWSVAVFPGVGVTDPPVVERVPQAVRSSVMNTSELIATKRRE